MKPTASPLDVTGLALNIVAQTSAFAAQSSFSSQSTMESPKSFTSSESVDMSFNYGGVGIVSTTQSNFTVDTLDIKSELLQVTEQAALLPVAEIDAVYGEHQVMCSLPCKKLDGKKCNRKRLSNKKNSATAATTATRLSAGRYRFF